MTEADKNAAPALLPADSVVVSIDVESLGKPPTAPVLKIGVSASFPDEPEGAIGCFFLRRVGLDMASAMGLGPVHPDVLQWWMKQSDAARFDTFECGANRFYNIWSAALQFSTIMQEIKDKAGALPCWLLIKRPQYDLPLLENFLRAGNQDPEEMLGSFRAVIDFATEQLRFKWLAQQFLPPEQAEAFMHVDRPDDAVPHTAHGDAFYQVACLRTWEKRLKVLSFVFKTTESQTK